MPARPLVLAASMLTLAVVLLAPGGGPAAPADADAAKPIRVSLSFSFQRDSGARLRQATLICEPDGRITASGWLANRPKRACEVARRQTSLLLAGPARGEGGTCLSQVYGPQRGRIYGTLASRGVNRAVSRTDSCRERFYQAVRPLFPKG
ncbi:hypothetical protein GKE82_13765 [Conexibacter sp. W3-3-2]|uniref:hypothetical protein n=1 Tax=Conexibacter sp. W3-3-2 TaxID=2675227 RepID=UPI0012B8E1B1|nr:hypothetical protein [Conexibacter sp. W3-3-2]MTD45324.1 hypothetical protein [Conexibacter sp. W3-3-2]